MDASIFQADRGPPATWPIRFQDADFEHRFAWCRSPLEGRSRRWIPFGMPRLNQNFLDGVFFVYGTDPQSGKYGPSGTGVLVGHRARGVAFNVYRHVYAVTCHHVISHCGHDIRINTKDGKSRTIEIEPHEWEFIPGGPDLAAVDVTERLFSARQQVAVCPPQMFADREFIEQAEVGAGEDGFMLGLFADHPGKERNLIAARFGNLSLLADETEPLKHPNQNRHPAHLFDMRSRPGFSGSPVYIYRTPAGDLRNATERGEVEIHRRQMLQEAQRRGAITPFGAGTGLVTEGDYEIRNNTFMMLLRIHAGQYHDRVTVKKAPAIRAELDVTITEGDKLSVPNSIAVVVPAWEIPILLNLEAFRKQRDAREAEDKRRHNETMPQCQREQGARSACRKSLT
jgi:hypothetical protein